VETTEAFLTVDHLSVDRLYGRRNISGATWPLQYQWMDGADADCFVKLGLTMKRDLSKF